MIAKKKVNGDTPSEISEVTSSMHSTHPILLTAMIAGVIMIGSALAVGHYMYEQHKAFQGRIYPDVTIEQIPVGELTKQQAQQKLQSQGFDPSAARITLHFRNEDIATFSATQLRLKLNTEAAVGEAYAYGRAGNWMQNTYSLARALFSSKTHNIPLMLSSNDRAVKEYVGHMSDQYNTKPQNALFSFENGKVTAFKQEANGNEIQEDVFLQVLDTTIQSFKDNPRAVTLTLTERTIQPDITLAKSNKFGIEELIGVGTSDYTHSAPERVHNVILAASKFNGVLIPPGEDLSFVDVIGDISVNTGYKTAYVIQNGRTVLGDGGGVCQVSTTLFRAALNTGLPIDERHAHAYRVSYYENDSKPGLDATIYSPTVDLKVKNDTPAHILVQTVVDESQNLLYFYIYGKKDGRKATVGDITVYDVSPPAEPKYEDDPTLPKGVVKQVDFAAWGGKSKFNYTVAYANGETKEETFFSNYRPWQAVYLRGTKE